MHIFYIRRRRVVCAPSTHGDLSPQATGGIDRNKACNFYILKVTTSHTAPRSLSIHICNRSNHCSAYPLPSHANPPQPTAHTYTPSRPQPIRPHTRITPRHHPPSPDDCERWCKISKSRGGPRPTCRHAPSHMGEGVAAPPPQPHAARATRAPQRPGFCTINIDNNMRIQTCAGANTQTLQ